MPQKAASCYLTGEKSGLADPQRVHLVNEAGAYPQVGDLVMLGDRVVGGCLADGTERLVVQDLVAGTLQKLPGLHLPVPTDDEIDGQLSLDPSGRGVVRILPDELDLPLDARG